MLTTADNLVVDETNFDGVSLYSELLLEMGEEELAKHLLNGCLKVLDDRVRESTMREPFLSEQQGQVYAALGMRREALDALRRQIIDGKWRVTPIWFDLGIYDFIRDDPEFQELMSIVHTDLAEQRARVRAMECNGELAPAPGVELPVVCE